MSDTTLDPIGDWYTAQDAKARRLAKELRLAKHEGRPESQINELRRKLEAARYVGD